MKLLVLLAVSLCIVGLIEASVAEAQVDVSLLDYIRVKRDPRYGYKRGKRVYRRRYKSGRFGCQDRSGSSSFATSDDNSDSWSNECFD